MKENYKELIDKFTADMKSIYESKLGPKVGHEEMDWVMENLLIELGFEEGIKYFRKQPRWYS